MKRVQLIAGLQLYSMQEVPPKPPICALKLLMVALEGAYFAWGAITHAKLAASSVLPLPLHFAISG